MKKIVIEVDTVWQAFRALYYALKHLRRNPQLETSVQTYRGYNFEIRNHKTIQVTAVKMKSPFAKDKHNYLYRGDICLRKYNIK